jgi:hypothetical protein
MQQFNNKKTHSNDKEQTDKNLRKFVQQSNFVKSTLFYTRLESFKQNRASTLLCEYSSKVKKQEVTI